jgi:hypothetical protein
LKLSIFLVPLLFFCAPASAHKTLRGEHLLGCWESEKFDETSILTDASNSDSLGLFNEKMLLKVSLTSRKSNLFQSHFYRWDQEGTYVSGPIYQNGVYNVSNKLLTFGYPNGKLHQVSLNDHDKVHYVLAEATSKKSSMSVRFLKRIDCKEADAMEVELLKKQEYLKGN